MTTIEVRPEWNTVAAEEGFELLSAAHPHIVPIVERVSAATRFSALAAEDRIRRMQSLREDHDEELRHIGHMQREAEHRGKLFESETKEIARRQAKVEKITARIAELAAIKPPSIFSMLPLNQFFAGVTEYARFEKVAMSLPRDPGKAAAEIEATRAKCVTLKRRARDTELGPLPLDDALEAAREQVRKLVHEGRPNVSALFRRPKDIAGRRRQGQIRFTEHIPPGGGLTMHPDPWPLIFWACEDTIMAKVESMLRAEAENHGTPIALPDRAPMLAKIAEEIETLEYREAALVHYLAEHGRTDVALRPDSDPLKVLLLRRLPDAKRPAKPAPSYDPAPVASVTVPLSVEAQSGWQVTGNTTRGGRRG